MYAEDQLDIQSKLILLHSLCIQAIEISNNCLERLISKYCHNIKKRL